MLHIGQALKGFVMQSGRAPQFNLLLLAEQADAASGDLHSTIQSVNFHQVGPRHAMLGSQDKDTGAQYRSQSQHMQMHMHNNVVTANSQCVGRWPSQTSPVRRLLLSFCGARSVQAQHQTEQIWAGHVQGLSY